MGDGYPEAQRLCSVMAHRVSGDLHPRGGMEGVHLHNDVGGGIAQSEAHNGLHLRPALWSPGVDGTKMSKALKGTISRSEMRSASLA